MPGLEYTRYDSLPKVKPARIYNEPILHGTLARIANRVNQYRGKRTNVPIGTVPLDKLKAYTNSLGHYNYDKGEMQINPNMLAVDSDAEIAATIAHEMQHADENLTRPEWEGEAFTSYRQRPTEIRAGKVEDKIRRDWFRDTRNERFLPDNASLRTKSGHYSEWVDPFYEFYSSKKK